ncbi:four helix bundle protein [Candidatus Falkowbacteria bacterium]|nr:four helix bundle protein [Candidatus Falkowbacteria bacterium]
MEKNKYKNGSHEKLIAWRMADELDFLVQNILRIIPRTEYKIKSQIDSASDSIGSNIVEGYYSNSTAEYIRFLRYARRSCGELQERIRRLLRKNYLKEVKYNEVNSMCIRTGYIIDRLINSL